MKLSDLHIRRHDDGTYAAIWGPFLLTSGFQPIFKMGAGPSRIGAFEALCRPQRDGVVSAPAQFFPLVPRNESYLVELQTRAVHVLNAPAVLTDREWLFLNFDPSMFTDGESIDLALNIMAETLAIADIDRKRVVCEVTEHKTSEINLVRLVSQIRGRGYRIAVDDFGAAESDMERVRKLSPDIVKFDAKWITNLMDSGEAGADLLKEMVGSFKQREIITLFEGIEHGWQLDLAVRCGVEFVQGFVLAKPQTVPHSFHDFRAKQDMNSTRNGHGSSQMLVASMLPSQSINRQPISKFNAFNAWDHDIASQIDAPQAGFASKAYPASDAAQPGSRAGVAPMTPAKSAVHAPTFGTRSASFGQKR